MSDGNGGAPGFAETAARLESRVEGYVAELREAMQAEASGRVELERLVNASRERERRLARAVSALEGGSANVSPRTVAAKPKRQRTSSQEVADEVLAVMRRVLAESDRDVVTRAQLAAEVPARSPETVRKALVLLRDQEHIRLAGSDGRGRTAPKLYALMPDDV